MGRHLGQESQDMTGGAFGADLGSDCMEGHANTSLYTRLRD